jgi:hypothetical protein
MQYSCRPLIKDIALADEEVHYTAGVANSIYMGYDVKICRNKEKLASLVI